MTEKLYPGIYKMRFGEPEELTPCSLRRSVPAKDSLMKLSDIDCVFSENDISHKKTGRGYKICLPLGKDEKIFGWGLQFHSFEQTGKKKVLRTNADPQWDSGESHAPVPFYISNKGYGVFIDSARDIYVYCGSSKETVCAQASEHRLSTDIEKLYKEDSYSGKMIIDIPCAKGADIYIFSGDSMKNAICRYNLFSGGGVLPPLWGLGFLYRGWSCLTDEKTVELAEKIRQDHIPCDCFGLEPGWHSHSYSCTYEWNKDNFPHHKEMIKKMKDMHFHMNLWEQAFIYKEAGFYEDIKKYSGDYIVWDGLVPDFTLSEARKIFSKRQKELIDEGIDAYKLDECDNSDYTGCWSYPHCTEFPSGLDGERMHNIIGVAFQETEKENFTEKRTYGQVRASNALAASEPFVLYSDLYNHKEFMNALGTAGFSGLLWTPEVRSAANPEDYIRRLQAVCLSPLATVNNFEVPLPYWQQTDREKNRAYELSDEAERQLLTDMTRDTVNFRMSMIPYLYNAFYNYYINGVPPVRAIVTDYPEDEETFSLPCEYMIGENILAAPIISGESNIKEIYLPEGIWYDFFTGEKSEGPCRLKKEYKLSEIPLFVKENSLIPYAEPKEYIDGSPFNINLRYYGNKPCSCRMIEDDGETYAYKKGELNFVRAYSDGHTERTGNYKNTLYIIKNIVKINKN